MRSNPPGALVYVDNQQIGTTPCAVDFIYYGTREIRLIKPGYETLTVNQPIPTPWYEVPGLDFVSEVLVPTKIRDNRTVTYTLAPQLVIPTQELVDRANQLRQDTLQPPAASLTSTAAGSVPGTIVVPQAPVAAPLPAAPEPLPGIGPPPNAAPAVPRALPAPQSSVPPVMLPRP
ncbi:MAG TPA: PEGA domain-containing protein [Lacipirellulaceae bacterium]|nr:PEGA domain-containing protein [Lacipirellulaceae bacterium]